MTLEIQRNELILSLFLYCFVLVFPFVYTEIEFLNELYYSTFSLLYYITNQRQAIGFFGFIFLCLFFITFYQILNIEDKKIQHYGSILNLILNSIIIFGVWSIKNQLTEITGMDFKIHIFFYFIYIIHVIFIIIMHRNFFVDLINSVEREKEILSERDILYYKSLEKLKKKNIWTIVESYNSFSYGQHT